MPRHCLRSLSITVIPLILAFGSLGCAFGNEHEYHVRFPSPVQGRGPVAIAVHDQRPQVVAGSEDDDYVGTQRGGFGNPFDVSTASDRPLADDWAASVSDSLKQGGFTPEVVPTRPQDAPQLVIRRMQETRARASLLFVIHAWHTDTFSNATLHRNVTLTVLSPAGTALATARSGGEMELGGSALDPAGHARDEVQREFVRTLRGLLSDAAVQNALRTGTAAAPSSAPPPPPPPPSASR
jgi:hypothetical protein